MAFNFQGLFLQSSEIVWAKGFTNVTLIAIVNAKTQIGMAL